MKRLLPCSLAAFAAVLCASCEEKKTPPRAMPTIDYVTPAKELVSNVPSDIEIVYPITEKSHHRYGFIDSTGRVLIEPIYNHVSVGPISRTPSTRIFVGQEGGLLFSSWSWVYIGKYGNRAFAPPTDKTVDFAVNLGDSLFYYVKKGRSNKDAVDDYGSVPIGVFDASDQWQPTEDILPRHWISEGLVPVTNAAGKAGYANRQGKIVIEPQFDHAESFYEGLATVRVGPHRGYIDRSGAMVIPPKYTHASWFENGVAIVVDPAAEFPQVIDTKGQVQNEIRTPIDFGWPKAIRGFNEGGLKVYLKVGPPDKVHISGLFQCGFLRPDDTWMIEPKLDSASFFHSGLTTVDVNVPSDRFPTTGSFIIDTQGKVLKKLSSQSAWVEFRHGLAGAQHGTSYVDRQGNVVWPPPPKPRR